MTSLPDVIRTGYSVVVLLLMRTVLLFAGTGIVLPFVGWIYNRALLWANVTVVIVDVITLLVLSRLLARQDRRLRDLLAPSWSGTAWGLLAFIILQIGFSASTFIGILVAYQGDPPASGVLHGVPVWMGWWALLVMPVTIALAEEGLYRGYAAEALESRFHKAAALVVIAFFFALQHAALTPLSPRAQLARFITTFLGGLLLGGMRWRCRRGLWPLVVAHWGLDVLGLGLPILLASQAS
ncbi:CPBP family intramembrane glutamic endopeptidase [Actinomyces oris]|uniref:CPBP family intramembrane glutamic endopeptidase n=1 Tax=Actinomyces oris TaxID=544580 RepID=UPI0028528138|nr:CPBP family intramembrane glutamic endopeptidase [Actinomyces oris]